MLKFLATVLFYFVSVTFTLADQDDWHVVKSTQQVTVKVSNRPWQAVKVGDVVANKAWIQTGPRGRAQLVRGTESIIIQPNSMAGIFTRGDIERKTKVIQQTGVLDLEIEKRNQPHTTVVTPYLAAVVKGTNFSVSVANGSAKVAVNRGLVEVTSYQTGQRANVGPGQRASVDTSKGMTVSGVRSAPPITSVAPSTAPVNAVGAVAPVGPAAVGSNSPGRAPSAPSIGASSAKGGSRSPDSDQSHTSSTDGDQKGRGGIRGSSGGQSRHDSGGTRDGSPNDGDDGAGNGNGNGHANGLGRGPGDGNAGVGNGNSGNSEGTGTGKADNGIGNGNGNGVGNGEGFGNGGNSGNGNNGNGKGNGGGNGTGNEGNGRGATSGNGNGNGNGKKD
jgi:hypothetical protein